MEWFRPPHHYMAWQLQKASLTSLFGKQCGVSFAEHTAGAVMLLRHACLLLAAAHAHAKILVMGDRPSRCPSPLAVWRIVHVVAQEPQAEAQR